MAQIPVNLGKASYTIDVGPGVWRSALSWLADYDGAAVITDENVNRLYGGFFDLPKIVVQSGEGGKTWAQAERVLEEMAGLGLSRSALVLALGGGVVGDLAGFCAAVYMRGIPYIQIPTTLLAQVDSGVGGKTGVDLGGFKNLAGAFHQPRQVLVDPAFLKTLPREEVVSGLGEVVKYGVIADPALLHLLWERGEVVFTAPHEALEDIIARCCAVKARLVERDEQDRGSRKQLNAGHTIAHGLESATGFRGFRHGEAVLLGLALEARLANRLGLLSVKDLQQIEKACQFVGLQEIPPQLSLEALLVALTRDKKNTAAGISFVLPRALGHVEEVFLSPAEVADHLAALIPNQGMAAPVSSLQILRKEINRCDEVLAETFAQRLNLVDEVAMYKRENALPIYDPQREEEILARYTGDVQRLFREILRISRGRQSRTLFPFNIALIGFMGTGKSTVGPILAESLGRRFIDLDQAIEERWGCSISQMFAEVGEGEFRRRESELLKEACQGEYLVIACGGGAVLSAANRQVLKETCRLVLLTATPKAIVERIGHLGDRPLLGGKPTTATTAKLLEEREPIYRAAADVAVATEGLTPQEVSAAIIAELNSSSENRS